jgi:hypothetical protein
MALVSQIGEGCARAALTSNCVAAAVALVLLNLYTLPILLHTLPVIAREEYLCTSTRLLHVSFCSWLDAFFQFFPLFFFFIVARKIIVGRRQLGTSTPLGWYVRLTPTTNVVLPPGVDRWFGVAKWQLSNAFYACIALGFFLFFTLSVYYYSFFTGVFSDGYLATSIPKLVHALSMHSHDEFATEHLVDKPCELSKEDQVDRMFIAHHVLRIIYEMTPRPLMFPTYGTLLGYVRYRNFLPWDSDVDYGVVTESMRGMSSHELVHRLRDSTKGITDTYYDYWLGALRVTYKNVHVDLTLWTVDKETWTLQRDNIDSFFFFLNHSLYHTIPIEAIMNAKMVNKASKHSTGASHGQGHGRVADHDMASLWTHMLKHELTAYHFGSNVDFMPLPANPTLLVRKFFPVNWWKELRPPGCEAVTYSCWDTKACPDLPQLAEGDTAFKPDVEPMIAPRHIFVIGIGVPVALFYLYKLVKAPSANKER